MYKIEHVEFLEERLKEIKKRIAASLDYREMKVLERIIEETKKSIQPKISNKESTSFIGEIIYPQEEGPLYTKIVKTGHSKDMNNSPGANMPHGERISRTYDIIEQCCLENGGSIDFDVLIQWLQEVYQMDWKDQNKNRTEMNKQSRLVAYIGLYNKKYPENIRLQLWPPRPENAKRMSCYEKIVYVGRQQIAI